MKICPTCGGEVRASDISCPSCSLGPGGLSDRRTDPGISPQVDSLAVLGRRRRLANQSAKLDPVSEQAASEEWFAGEAPWPDY